MTNTKLETLHEQFKSLTPEERNDRLQAIYAAKLEEISTSKELEGSIELFKTLIKSFEMSNKFEADSGDGDDDAF